MTNPSTTARPVTANTQRQRHHPTTLVAGMLLGLTVSFAAYAQNNGNSQIPSLKPLRAGLSLDTIKVTSSTASGYAIDPQHAPASISIVTGEEMQGKAYRDVRQALRDVPGVYVTSSQGRGGIGEIRMRGMSSKYTLVLVNGIPQGSGQAYYNGYGQGAEFSWLPPVSAIKRIEVIRGPMSTLYGSAALGGVINIITKPVAEQWHGAFSASTTLQEDPDSGDYQQANVRISGPLIEDVLGLSFNATGFTREEDNIPGGYADYLRRNANIKLNWAVNDNNELTFGFGLGRQDSASTLGQSATRGATDFRTERARQTIRHELHWGERWTTRSYIQREEVDQTSGAHSTYERITANTQSVLPFRNHLFTVGVHYRVQRIDHPERGRGAKTLERWDAALYAEHQWFMTDAFTLTWGLRYVYDEKYGGEMVPRIYGTYDLTAQLTLKGGVSAGYRTPNLKQGDALWVENACGPRTDCIIVGNSGLKPEKSTTYELGLYYHATVGIRSSLTLFHTDFTNKIGRHFIQGDNTRYNGVFAPDGVKQYTNIGEATINGVEVALSTPLTPDLDVSASYTYTHSEQETGQYAGYPLTNQPKHLVTLGLNWQATTDTQLWAEARYQSETLDMPSSHGNARDSNPGYSIVDVGASHQLTNTVSIYGGVYNLLDKEIKDEYDRILDGRRYNIGFRVSF